MAEIKTGIFAKNVQKRLNRAQEKVRVGGEEEQVMEVMRRADGEAVLEAAGGPVTAAL